MKCYELLCARKIRTHVLHYGMCDNLERLYRLARSRSPIINVCVEGVWCVCMCLVCVCVVCVRFADAHAQITVPPPSIIPLRNSWDSAQNRAIFLRTVVLGPKELQLQKGECK